MTDPVYRRIETLRIMVCWSSRVNKNTMMSAMSNFYHEDELMAAKAELVSVVGALTTKPEGWSKLVSAKVTVINRKCGEVNDKRNLHAEDLYLMSSTFDMAKVTIPCYFALVFGRIPPAPFTVVSSTNHPLQPMDGDAGASLRDFVSDLASMVGSLLKRLNTMEKQSVFVVNQPQASWDHHGQKPCSRRMLLARKEMLQPSLQRVSRTCLWPRMSMVSGFKSQQRSPHSSCWEKLSAVLTIRLWR